MCECALRDIRQPPLSSIQLMWSSAPRLIAVARCENWSASHVQRIGISPRARSRFDACTNRRLEIVIVSLASLCSTSFFSITLPLGPLGDPQIHTTPSGNRTGRWIEYTGYGCRRRLKWPMLCNSNNLLLRLWRVRFVLRGIRHWLATKQSMLHMPIVELRTWNGHWSIWIVFRFGECGQTRMFFIRIRSAHAMIMRSELQLRLTRYRRKGRSRIISSQVKGLFLIYFHAQDFLFQWCIHTSCGFNARMNAWDFFFH